MMRNSQQLLADYAATRSEPAFRELVTRYLNLVYSTAFRLVDGDTHLAEDVTQTVFVDLSREANTMPGATLLGGWLHRHTCFIASKMMRGERRRLIREQHAAEMNALNTTETGLAEIAPVLDEVINELKDDDRKAILLRFYERQDLRSIGEALGSSENAAQKRVSRALDQLHLMLRRRGIALSAAALGTALASEAIAAAPTGLVSSIMGTVLAGAAGGTGAAITVTKAVIMTKAKLTLFGMVVVGAVAIPLVLQHLAQVRLRAENVSLRQRLAQLDQLANENERLSNLLAQSDSAQSSLPTDEMHEILRLRGEVGRLRQENQDIAKQREDKRQLPMASAKQPPVLTSVLYPPLMPAGTMKFGGVDFPEVLKVYCELVQVRLLEMDEQLKSSRAKIRLTNTESVTREEAIRLLDNAFLAQAGIVVTHPGSNHVVMRMHY